MYCLSGFRKGKHGAEERSSYLNSSGYVNYEYGANMEILDSPSELPKRIESISSYEPPSLFCGKYSTVLSKKHRARKQADRLRGRIGATSVEDEETESRFQLELEKMHPNMNMNTKVSKRLANAATSDIEWDFDGMRVTDHESSIMNTHRRVPQGRNEGNNSNLLLQRENESLKTKLERSNQLLECAREEKTLLRSEIEILKIQVDALRATQGTNLAGNDNETICDFKRQMTGYQQQVKDEQSKRQKIEQELESTRKENQKCREKMHLLMFQHGLSDSQTFPDIGPSNRNIIESAGKVATYQLGTSLGEGHYGKVAQGIDLKTQMQYAVKVLNKNKIKRFKDLQQVATEIHALKMYPHENIIRLQEVIHAPQNLYIVTELCSMDLHQYHNEVGLSEHGSQQVIMGVLKPLHHLHSHGISHLDLKPENILLRANFNPNKINQNDIRLCDFGLVNMAPNPTKSKDIIRKDYVCGTPGFFAPEMILDRMFEGRRADMWSLGCIILEITLGFTQEWIESYDLIEKSPSAFRSGIEKCLEEIAPDFYPQHLLLMDIIHRCLALDALNRIQSSEAICHPWLNDIRNSEETRQDYTDSTGSTNSRSSSEDSYYSQVYSQRNGLVSSAILS